MRLNYGDIFWDYHDSDSGVNLILLPTSGLIKTGPEDSKTLALADEGVAELARHVSPALPAFAKKISELDDPWHLVMIKSGKREKFALGFYQVRQPETAYAQGIDKELAFDSMEKIYNVAKQRPDSKISVALPLYNVFSTEFLMEWEAYVDSVEKETGVSNVTWWEKAYFHPEYGEMSKEAFNVICETVRIGGSPANGIPNPFIPPVEV